jgi:hypothetical protein
MNATHDPSHDRAEVRLRPDGETFNHAPAVLHVAQRIYDGGDRDRAVGKLTTAWPDLTAATAAALLTGAIEYRCDGADVVYRAPGAGPEGPAGTPPAAPPADARAAAAAALEAGLSAVPPREDGTKAPDGRWKEYQRSRATSAELGAWYGTRGRPKRAGVGLVCGAVSGGLECLEFDAGGEAYEWYKARARALGLGDLVERVEAGYLERSPSGGVHWLYRSDPVDGNTKLADRYKDPAEFNDYDREAVEKAAARGKAHRPVQTLIETRGEGGYVVVAPSGGGVHPSGRPYERLRGGFKTIATITPDEREALWNVARSFDSLDDGTGDRAEAGAAGAHPDRWDDVVTPWDDYNARARWDDLLPGWAHVYDDGEEQHWRRAGKDQGVSATLNRNGSDRLYVFSTSTGFEALKPYTKFGAYARLEHGDDFKAAVRALSRAGYGQFRTWVKVDGEWRLETRQNPAPKGVRVARAGEGPPAAAPQTPSPSANGTRAAEPPEPEPWGPLRLGELPPAPDFPLDVLPDDAARLAHEASGAIGCDPGLVAGPVLATAGGLIGRSASLLQGSNWFASACLFQANVALPGDGKTPAVGYATDPVLGFDRALADAFEREKADYRERLEAYERDKKKPGVGPRPSPPVPKRVVMDDVTMEAVSRVLAANARGVVMVRDELAALVLGLNQYKNGGGSDRPNLLKIWSGKSVVIDRVQHEFGEPVRIPFPFLSIAGNLTPAMLGELANRRGDDGFIDRWLYVYPDRRPKLKSAERRPVSDAAVEGWAGIAKRLWAREMHPGDGSPRPHVVTFTAAGKAEFDRRHDDHVDEVNAADFPDSLSGAWSKLEEYAARLCLVLTLLRHAADPTVDPAALPCAGAREAADAWRLVAYFKAHHRRVRASLHGRGLGGAPEGVRVILRWLRNHPDTTAFPESELTRDFPLFCADRAGLEDSLQWLAQRNALRRVAGRTPRDGKGKGGRKPAPVWEVHPSLKPSENSDNSENSGSAPSHPTGAGRFSELSEFSEGLEGGEGPDPYAAEERRAIQAECSTLG